MTDNVVHIPVASAPLRLIDKAELLRRVPFSYSLIWQLMNRGEFPRSRDTGGKSTWLEHEVEAWIASRPIKELKIDRPAGSSPHHPNNVAMTG